ncbi:site-specific DNA-methyltransferase [Ruminococcus bicirculans (ex Wegman et al. 2014)]|uniref:site-specific DNA-methyltransferase n=1 Tax=Ruminococcus bicirculans (ex Wegman et al. 2014) TaxID=1160721 RepID=UPI0016480896|nr:site-specific DNA-methyltransferase [Ruminococcus bicirculans (ex Wegman et al. 2014)]MBC3513225.1 site-specific DNA-methyltransferase [Ruminococcus bicirculans (ex Wegman et al. 2014)]
MTKLKMRTQNKADENYKKLSELFPNAVTETIDETTGEVIRAIDKDVLMQEINTHVVDGKEERYQFTWPDKKKSVLLANSPIAETLRPCREESVDFDNTENLYIEGDNLDVLKLLQETYLGKVKMIYIDPPYNTGNDFVYNDDFAENTDDYLDRSGQFDDDGNRLFHNTESNGRFHTDWLNMIYPRLKIARNLLSDDGVIFISLDDNESTNAVKICDEIFGASNRIALICHKSRASISNDKIISPNHNIILFYAKKIELIEANRKMIGLDPILDDFKYNDNDGKGEYRLVPVDGPGGAKKGNPFYSFLGIEGYWRFSKETMQEKYNQGLVVKRGNSLYQKYYKSLAASTRRTATTWWDDGGLTSTATSKLKKLMGNSTFDTPKPLELIDRMLKMITFQNKEAIILDFFSGSATTAHAVMQLNAEDGGHRKFIMVQLPEKTDEKSEAFKAGYKNICEIGKERIRRAGKKIKAQLMAEGKETRDIAEKKAQGNAVAVSKSYWIDSPEYKSANKQMASDLDTGFRVLKLDSTNMKEVYYNPAEITIDTIMGTVDNIKEDRTPEDLLFQVMLDLGVLLSSKIEQSTIGGKTVFNVEDSYLIACFDDNVTDEVITAIAKQKPYYFVMRDSSMANDSVATNFEQIFAAYSPDTVRKVL